MKITLITQGTHGDVQPYVALGKALKSRGHHVTVATAASFCDFITAHGLEFQPIAGDPKEVLESFEAMTEGGSPLDNLKFIRATLPRMGADMLKAAHGTEAVASNYNVSHLAYSVAEKLGVPFFDCGLVPMLSTSTYPNPHIFPIPPRWWPRALNRLTHAPIDQLLWQPFRTVINRFRRDHLDLPPYPFGGYAPLLARRNVPRLEAYSRHLMPSAADWGSRVHLTGFWFLDHDSTWQPPDSLVRFLNTDPKPIYIGFGSMNFGSAAERTQMIIEAVKRSGQRVVAAMGWGGLDSQTLPDTIYPLDKAPHDWLFPRVASVVHHGGAGTTAAALRAGVPQFIVTFLGDQPFWGHRIAALGLGLPPVPRKKLTVEHLTQALTGHKTFADNAHRFSELIKAESGVTGAADIIEATVA